MRDLVVGLRCWTTIRMSKKGPGSWMNRSSGSKPPPLLRRRQRYRRKSKCKLSTGNLFQQFHIIMRTAGIIWAVNLTSVSAVGSIPKPNSVGKLSIPYVIPKYLVNVPAWVMLKVPFGPILDGMKALALLIVTPRSTSVLKSASKDAWALASMLNVGPMVKILEIMLADAAGITKWCAHPGKSKPGMPMVKTVIGSVSMLPCHTVSLNIVIWNIRRN